MFAYIAYRVSRIGGSSWGYRIAIWPSSDASRTVTTPSRALASEAAEAQEAVSKLVLYCHEGGQRHDSAHLSRTGEAGYARGV